MDKIEEKLWRRVDRFRFVLNLVPFVRMVAVCNNLSFGRVDENSDIDLFVVARKGRLFVARAFLAFFLHIFGVRRHGNKVKGRFCLSFFVDESHLGFSSISLKNDVYLAYWIYKLVPVVGAGSVGVEVVTKLENKNRWIETVLKGKKLWLSKEKLKKKSFIASFFRILMEILMFGFVGDFLEKVLGSWQLKRATAKARKLKNKAGLVITSNVLKFHNVDRRLEYNMRYWKVIGGSGELFDESTFLDCLVRSPGM